MSSQKDKGRQNPKALYSEDFQAMLEKLEEEDNADTNKQLMKKSRLCIEKVKALERHFELENRLQPERKLKIAEEVGLEPRQVAIWFQNRRARWRAKQLEKEYDDLRANYDALKQDYGSLEQEKLALLAQLKELKAKIKSRDESDASIIPITTENSRNMRNNNDQSSKCMNEELPSSYTTTTTTTLMDPLFDMSAMDGLQLCKAYQDHYLMKMEELGVHNMINNNNNNISSNFFSVDDHAPSPTMHYYWFNNNNNNNDHQ